jgi:dephospho-CoA kinase
LIDADAISRVCTASGGAAIAQIRAQFGPGFVAADGAMARERMRRHVFDNPAAKTQLEAIIHPLVAQQIAAEADALAAGAKACIVFDIPLLVESGHWRKKLDQVLVVDCSAATQTSRVLARSGLEQAQIQQIMALQASRQQRLAAADIVLLNDGISLAVLAARVQQLCALLRL